ncbi:MAG: hypothetical protein LKI34_02075 [Bifidobacterium tibiigranuli]|uniref:hypothetical protein n=1 Tax=Bifidobacterium tibiigranuli TaxID=2172043 RepID=UPI0026EF673A|nr:hypothetical protein [Bifidobacterium tibiigranuli]MCI1672994.1 hypothetical protein [Bifidobacterium tibiigranuli]MCI1713094.1 hypothetical protein [Bifidobacterium tibiigranuli]MCI1834988.1 hypothetical protein [Bifidobacterium tibiigranuli]
MQLGVGLRAAAAGIAASAAAFVTFAVIVCVLCIAIGLMLAVMRNRIGSVELANSVES